MSEESKILPPNADPDNQDEGSAPTTEEKGKGKAARVEIEPGDRVAEVQVPIKTITAAEAEAQGIKLPPGFDPNRKVGTLDKKVIDQLMKANPSLKAETEGMDPEAVQNMIARMQLSNLLAGMATGKNAKDMASYKFWQTQPVARFDEDTTEEGEIRKGDLDKVSKEPPPLLDEFEWVVMDLNNDKEIDEVYNLLNNHYVEDDEAMFRFKYSVPFFNWALKSPGWKKEWHIGVRVKTSQRLVAFISGIPVTLRVRSAILKCSEINFLCIHKKLRNKRLAPILIKEITRRCNLDSIWQAIYTGGVVLPKPVSSCRYYHRSLDWLKLHEVGFSPLPHKSTKARQITKYALPTNTSIEGLRELKKEDIPATKALLDRYLARFELAPEYDAEEFEHWFLNQEGTAASDRVIWTYVVEDPKTNKITDFFSFYSLESSIINNKKHDTIRAAYLFYYATETALKRHRNVDEARKATKIRLNDLINDALIIAKKENFDVFNALTLLDNTLFLGDQKFGAGDGQLHFYLFNWRTPPIRGGMDEKMALDEKNGSGIGMVML